MPDSALGIKYLTQEALESLKHKFQHTLPTISPHHRLSSCPAEPPLATLSLTYALFSTSIAQRRRKLSYHCSPVSILTKKIGLMSPEKELTLLVSPHPSEHTPKQAVDWSPTGSFQNPQWAQWCVLTLGLINAYPK